MSAIAVVGLAVAGLVVGCSDDRRLDSVEGGAPVQGGVAAGVSDGACDWPTWGFDNAHSFVTPCASAITAETVGRLGEHWFFNTDDAVSGSPIVVDGTVYVGDWGGAVYAIAVDDGELRWRVDLPRHDRVYAGQITGTVTLVDGGAGPMLYVAAGRTVHALRPEDGSVVWSHPIGAEGEPAEIEGATVVADGIVVVGYDTHNQPGFPAGLRAIDAVTGDQVWDRVLDENGCADVWGTPTVDVERRLVYAGTGNCTDPARWSSYTEAIVAADLDTGAVVWSYQPHEPNNDDLDFAGAPNLFSAEIDGTRHDLVGLGNKDGDYYAVERESGELMWVADATEPGLTESGQGFSTGGFIGPAAVVDGVIVGATAVGPEPFLHGIDAASGEILWQQPRPGPSYAGPAVVNGIAFVGGTDFTLRAIDSRTGEIYWSAELAAVIAGVPTIVGDSVYAVAGMYEPGSDTGTARAGVYRFSLDPPPPSESTTTSTTSATAESASVRVVDDGQPCIDETCDRSAFLFLKEDPPGTAPDLELTITSDPFTVELVGRGFGPPEGWLREGGAATSAATYALFASESDDDPNGGLICVLDDRGDGSIGCRGDAVPIPGRRYSRLSVLAVDDPSTLPGPAEGFDRLVATISFDPPLQTEVVP